MPPTPKAPRTALITGASRGLGLGLARSLALDHGVHVALVARNSTALTAAASAIQTDGGQAVVITADLADPQSAPRIAGQAHAALGEIDLVVHNASTLGPTPLRPLLDSTADDFQTVLEINLLAPFRITHALLGAMLLRRRGSLVFISSDAAIEAYPDWGLYGVSKAALDHLARIWAAELAGSGVRVLSIDPGEMNTRMHAEALPDADRSSLPDPQLVGRSIAALLASQRGPQHAPQHEAPVRLVIDGSQLIPEAGR